MNNDELLALYLDNALTGTQRQDFESRLQSSPELLQEVRELSAIQNMLVSSVPDDEHSLTFLRGMEDHIAASVIASGAAVATSVGITALGAKTSVATSSAAVSGATSLWSSLVASVSSSVVGASIAAATVVGGGAATYYAVTKSHTPTSSEANIQATNNKESLKNSTTVPSNSLQYQTASDAASTASPTASTTTEPERKAETLVSRELERKVEGSAEKSAEYSARISGGTTIKGRYAASIEEYTRQLQEKESAGDRIGVALTEKSLGSLLRQAGQFAESRRHLQNALKGAQSLAMKELEGETLGELGLLFLAEGKKALAEEKLRTAVSILTASQSQSVSRWQQELNKAAQ